MAHTEKSIIETLTRYYSECLYRAANLFVFAWESDFFIVQKKTGYCWEIEIKVTRSDFMHDFKKTDKHSILHTGKRPLRRSSYDHTQQKRIETVESIEEKFRPNRFFYCVPEGMIAGTEVPYYAGLMYIDRTNSITIVKPAPLIHKEKLDLESRLCNKFYFYWQKAKADLQYDRWDKRDAEIKIKNLEKHIADLEEKLKIVKKPLTLKDKLGL